MAVNKRVHETQQVTGLFFLPIEKNKDKTRRTSVTRSWRGVVLIIVGRGGENATGCLLGLVNCAAQHGPGAEGWVGAGRGGAGQEEIERTEDRKRG